YRSPRRFASLGVPTAPRSRVRAVPCGPALCREGWPGLARSGSLAPVGWAQERPPAGRRGVSSRQHERGTGPSRVPTWIARETRREQERGRSGRAFRYGPGRSLNPNRVVSQGEFRNPFQPSAAPGFRRGRQQLYGGVRALRAPVDNLTSNWAYMVMTALAW